MNIESGSKTTHLKSSRKANNDVYAASKIILLLLLLAILSSFFAIVGAGELGVLMQFGKVQE